MEKPKKQILYKPPTQVETGGSDEIINRINTTAKKRSECEKLAEWIKNATLINRTALCKESNVDRANLDKYLLKGTIPEHHIEALTKILKSYGYA